MSFIVKNRSRLGTNPGYYFSGSQVETTGSTFEYCRIIQNTMLQMSSSVSGGWNLWFTHDPNDFDIIGANYNRTFMSRGDETLTSSLGSEYNGDFRSYINIRRYSDTYLQIYTSKYVRNSDGVTIGEWFASWYGALNATSSFDWWAFGNEYEYHFITATPSMAAPNVVWRYVGWGNPYPNHLPDDHRGIAFAPAGITSGSNILITLDRNMDDPTLPNGSFKPGYPIYISGFAPGGSSAVAPATADLTRVVSITGNQLVVEFLKQNYDCPVVIGHRPMGTSVWGDASPLNMAGGFVGTLDGSGSGNNAMSDYNQRSLANNASRHPLVAPDNQYFHHTNIPQSVQGTTNTPLGTSRIIRYPAHPNPRPTASQSVLYDEINDLYYIFIGITGSGGVNTNWNWPFFQYSGSLEGKTVISGVFDEQFVTHTKPINLNPPDIPATSSWFFSNGYGGSYENWSRNTLVDPVVFGIDFEVTNCLPCFEDIIQRQNLIYEEDYNNSLMKSNIYQFVVPTSSAVQSGGEPCIVPQAPFIYGIPSARAVLGRQKYRAPGTSTSPSNLPDFAQELTASC